MRRGGGGAARGAGNTRPTHFVALRVSDAGVLQRLTEAQDALLQKFPSLASAQRIEAQKMHFTLALLSLSAPEEQLPVVENVLRSALHSVHSVPVVMRGLHCFGGGRVVFAQLWNAWPVQHIAKRVRDAFNAQCADLHYEDKPFNAHCTLFKGEKDRDGGAGRRRGGGGGGRGRRGGAEADAMAEARGESRRAVREEEERVPAVALDDESLSALAQVIGGFGSWVCVDIELVSMRGVDADGFYRRHCTIPLLPAPRLVWFSSIEPALRGPLLEQCYKLECESYPADEAATFEKMQLRTREASDLFLVMMNETGNVVGFINATSADGEVRW